MITVIFGTVASVKGIRTYLDFEKPIASGGSGEEVSAGLPQWGSVSTRPKVRASGVTRLNVTDDLNLLAECQCVQEKFPTFSPFFSEPWLCGS